MEKRLHLTSHLGDIYLNDFTLTCTTVANCETWRSDVGAVVPCLEGRWTFPDFLDVGSTLAGIARSKRDGTRAETRFGLSAKRASPLNRRWCQFSRLLAVEECGSADSNCIDRVPTYSARLLATHSIRIFPLHFPSCASPCGIRFRTGALPYPALLWVVREQPKETKPTRLVFI